MNKEIINGIRQYYQLPGEITDNQITQKIKGSTGEAVVILGIAKKNFVKSLKEALLQRR